MHWVGRFLSTLLAVMLVLSVGSWLLNTTVWSASYLQAKTTEVKLADGLAKALPEVLAASTSSPGDTRVMLSFVLTPAYINDQLETMLTQLERYSRRGDVPPQLDLSDLATDLRSEGFEIPPELAPVLNQPHPIASSDTSQLLRSAVLQTAQLTWLAPLVAVAFALIIAGLMRHRRWLTLAGACFGAALGLLALAGLAQLPPGLIASNLATSPAQALAPPTRALAESIARDHTHTLLWAAAAFGTAAAVLAGLHVFLKLTGHFRKSAHGHGGH